MKKIRYGIVGAGGMGRAHIDTIQALGLGDVVALAEPHAASLDATLARCHGMPKVFASHLGLLASGLCDAVVVATPSFTHAGILRDVLEAGVHVLVEGPLVTRLDDGLDLVERERRHATGHRVAWVAQPLRHEPSVVESIRRVREGQLGRVHQVAIRDHRGPWPMGQGGWNRFTENTGGTLVEVGSHHFDLFDAILHERPWRVYASGGQRVNHLDERIDGRTPDVLDSAYVVVEYPSGARALLDLCLFAPDAPDGERLAVVGDQGRLEVPWRGVPARGAAAGTAPLPVPVRREHAGFARAIRDRLPAEVDLRDGLHAVATGLAARLSLAEGRVIDMTDMLPAGW